jgi:NAD(P)H dehydrogenase (quinone)
MIVITGANGAFGRRVTERLLARRPGIPLAVSVRDPAASPFATGPGRAGVSQPGASGASQPGASGAGQPGVSGAGQPGVGQPGVGGAGRPGVSVRRGDFDEPESLPAAFAGADTVLINGTNYGTAPDVRARQQATALRAALDAGATRIVVTSWPDVENCPLALARDYPGTEKLVMASAPAWTILRMTYGMAASLARDVNTAARTGLLTAPAGEAQAVPASVEDLADAAAAVLTEPGHDHRIYELTGPAPISWHDLAGLAAERSGRGVEYRPASGEEFGAQTRAAGWPPAAVDSLLEYYAAFRAGWGGRAYPDLATLLGRPATGSLDAVRQVL